MNIEKVWFIGFCDSNNAHETIHYLLFFVGISMSSTSTNFTGYLLDSTTLVVR